MTGEYTISARGARAVVTEVGATLREFTFDGVPYVESFAALEKPPLGSGCVLVPWPNRVAGARWTLDGEPQRLDVTEPARGNAIHGLVRKRPWRRVDAPPRRDHNPEILMEIDIQAQQGWPIPLYTSVSYVVGDHGLAVTHTVRNDGDAPVPFGVGTHPYPRAGNSATDECTLTLAASTTLPLDPQRMVPTSPAVDVPAELDFRAGKPLAGVELDTAFGGCLPGDDGLIKHWLTGPAGSVVLWAQPDFRWVQVFTPSNYPNRGRAVAIEPMTCPPDALNSGVDLITLAPGESWSGSWGLAPQIDRRTRGH